MNPVDGKPSNGMLCFGKYIALPICVIVQKVYVDTDGVVMCGSAQW